MFFSNSNIYPEAEYLKRLEQAKKIARLFNLELVVDNYMHNKWREHVKGLEGEAEGGERCRKCFEFSLQRTAEKARALDILFFATTLTVSPHKNKEMIFETGGKWQGFKEYDFKKQDGFKKSVQLSKQYGLYRQNYCGCEFSLRGS